MLWCAAMVAALFAVHPLHVESVAWVAERKDVLSMFFLLCTLWAYQAYTRKPGGLSFLLVALLLACGLLSKPMLVTLPVLLLLIDVWPLQRWSPSLPAAGSAEALPAAGFQKPTSLWWLLVEKIPLLGLALAAGLMTLQAQRSASDIVELQALSLPGRLTHAIHAYCWYLWKTVFPFKLNIHYLHSSHTPSTMTIVLEGIALGAFLIWVLSSRRSRPWVFMGGCWFFISLLPVIGLVQVGLQAFADRYSYVPHLGLLILMVWQAEAVLAACRAPRPVAGILSMSAIAVCTLLTVLQIGYWKNSRTLFARAVQCDPQNWFAMGKLGNTSYRENDFDSAGRYWSEAILLNPQDSLAILNLGLLRLQQQRLNDGRMLFEQALRLKPRNLQALYNLGVIFRLQGEPEAARVKFQAMLQVEPDNLSALSQLAELDAESGRFEQALQTDLAILKLNPGIPQVHAHAAKMLLRLNRPEEALRQMAGAIEMFPREPGLYQDLSSLLEDLQRDPEALQAAEQALLLQPGNPALQKRVDSLRQRLGKEK
jgi:tetratricopeptide (TPR) repeat protein